MSNNLSPADFNKNATASAEKIRTLIQNIEQSGSLGRSKVYLNLLRYLGEATINGTIPKEVAIAIEVLGKDADFDVSSDSLVRVYIHKLRQKLDAYYADKGSQDAYRISIPKGQYSLQISPREITGSASQPGNETPLQNKRYPVPIWLLGLIALLFLANLAWLGKHSLFNQEGELAQLAESPLWQPILGDDEPVVLVIGDYFIFGEHRGPTQPDRLVREYHVNSPEDLGQLKRNQNEASEADNYYNLDLTYIPRATAYAMRYIMPVLTAAGKEIDIRMSSQITGSDLKSQHIIYIGYLSAMRELTEFAFAGSNLAIGSSFDQLIELDSGEIHDSSEIESVGSRDAFSDFGMLSSFATMDGHQMMIIAGTRDTGLMHMAQLSGDLDETQSINQWLDQESRNKPQLAFETLYRVLGYDGVNFNAEQLYIGELAYEKLLGNQ